MIIFNTMKKILYLLLVFHQSCTINKQNNQPNNFHKLTFSVESITNDITKQIYPSNSDSSTSFNSKVQEIMKRKMEREAKYPNELYIEITNNGWKRQRFIGNEYIDYFKYNINKDSFQAIRHENNQLLGTYKLERDSCTCIIDTDKSRSKKIMGHECHFVRIEERCGHEDFKNLFGTQIFEMWVTEAINIPTFVLLKTQCITEGFFPLETKQYLSNSIENYHIYTIKKIE